ncbi:MAG: PAS domain S-box protein [Alphaproteobacteria bacterium]|nr:PAS domain S-box protein [Alphaproteobacteria bacterium]MCZ6589647.1 PAS domain S-box protein [Alphaproteobacteria bacterium]MCZ6845998.1 PAS domain S-box protein [Alphaproteobacteria bacterium]
MQEPWLSSEGASWDANDPDDEGRSPENLEQTWEALVNGQMIRAEGCQRRKDGSTFPVEVNLAMMDIGGQQNIIVIARDVAEHNRITEEALVRVRDEAEQGNRAKFQFVAGTSHDRRQPLQTLNLFTSVLQSSNDLVLRHEAIHRREQTGSGLV